MISLAIQGAVDPDYSNYRDRIIYLHNNLKDSIDGFDIGFFSYQIDELQETFNSEDVTGILEVFNANSLHVASNKSRDADPGWVENLITFANDLFEKSLITSVCLHLDLIDLFDEISSETTDGLMLNWEVLGSDAPAGNTLEEVEKAIVRFPRWGMTLDVAHIMEMEHFGQPGVGEYLKKFRNKIRQIHFSWPDNLYSENQVGPDFVTSHSMVNLDTSVTEPLIRHISDFDVDVITIEGVIPFGANGLNLVKEEVRLIKKYINR